MHILYFVGAEATDSPTMAAKISSRKVSWKEYKPSVLEVPTRSPRSGSGIDDSQTLEPGASGALDFKVSPESDSGYAQLLAQRGGAIENPFARESPGPAANLFACLDGWRSLAPESPHQQVVIHHLPTTHVFMSRGIVLRATCKQVCSTRRYLHARSHACTSSSFCKYSLI